MPDPANTTVRLSDLFDRIRAGDRAARERLAAALYDRTIRITASMLRGFPVVQQRRSATDLAQDLWVRMLTALDAGLRTQTTAEFMRVAADRLRKLLIDEARKYRGRVEATRRRHPHGDGETVGLNELEGAESGAGYDPTGPASGDPAHLAQWCEFHELVGALPELERQVVELRFYAGESNKDAAAALGVSEDQARRLWQSACVKLADYLPQID